MENTEYYTYEAVMWRRKFSLKQKRIPSPAPVFRSSGNIPGTMTDWSGSFYGI